MPHGTADTRYVLTPRLVVGLAIALLGTLLTMDRIGLLEADLVLRFWPLVLVAIGGLLVARQRPGERVNGMILLAIGVWLLISSIWGVRIRFWELFWPVVLILIGVNLARQAVRRQNTPRDDDSSRLNIFAVLSGVKRASSAGRFRGGDIVAFMGGGQLDLRQATIASGEEAVLDIVAVMAGLEVWVPPGWAVSTPLVPVMGGVEDKRLPPLTTTDAPPPRLILRGFVLMGGIMLKS
jgi:predicted membrane protein